MQCVWMQLVVSQCSGMTFPQKNLQCFSAARVHDSDQYLGRRNKGVFLRKAQELQSTFDGMKVLNQQKRIHLL